MNTSNNSKTRLKAQFKRQNIENKIRTIAAKLFELAPHPDRPDQRGPAFVKLSSQFNPASESDGLMGGIVLDMKLGTALTSIANDNLHIPLASLAEQIDLSQAIDAIGEYLGDREDAHFKTKGQGSFARTKHKTLCNHFSTTNDEAYAAWRRDYPKRMKLESTLAVLQKSYGFALYTEQSYTPA